MKITSTNTEGPRDRLSFNCDALLSRVNNDFNEVLELISLFLDICPDSLQRLEAAVEQVDAEAIREAAHRFKGSLQFIHAEPAVEAAQKLELMGRRRELHLAGDGFDDLAKRIKLLERELYAFLEAAND